MIDRHLKSGILAALSDTPVVLLNGARQSGKSTLARQIIDRDHPARYLTLDDAGVLSAALADPSGFLAGMQGPIVIDEIQRAPELFLAIKSEVDRNRQSGRFLLTGSADVLLLPRLSDSLAGRMEILTLWPLSQGEVETRRERFIDAMFADRLPEMAASTMAWDDLISRIIAGGYPEALGRSDHDRRQAWYGSYIGMILQRDIRDLSNIEGLTALPRLLSLLATRTSTVMNISEISRSIAIPQTTLKRYMALLEMTFLVQTLPAWSSNLGKRLVKAPKLMLCDTGLISHLIGLDAGRLRTHPELAGQLLETFVTMEIRKQASWNSTRVRSYHYRTQSGQEVDLILEDAAGRVVGIEVKAARSITASSFNGLRSLAEQLGESFVRGIVLYSGSDIIPFDRNMHAMPIDALWMM